MRKRLLSIVLFCFSLFIAKGDESNKGYRAYIELALGDAYNFNTAQTISTNNMQLYSMISTTHGYQLQNWFVGGGVGYCHSYRDKETMYPLFAAGRYSLRSVRFKPYLEARAGIIYDPRWVSEVQAYGALGAGINVHKRLRIGLRGSIFSRPSRYFTANAAVVFSYELVNSR